MIVNPVFTFSFPICNVTQRWYTIAICLTEKCKFQLIVLLVRGLGPLVEGAEGAAAPQQPSNSAINANLQHDSILYNFTQGKGIL